MLSATEATLGNLLQVLQEVQSRSNQEHRHLAEAARSKTTVREEMSARCLRGDSRVGCSGCEAWE